MIDAPVHALQLVDNSISQPGRYFKFSVQQQPMGEKGITSKMGLHLDYMCLQILFVFLV